MKIFGAMFFIPALSIGSECFQIQFAMKLIQNDNSYFGLVMILSENRFALFGIMP